MKKSQVHEIKREQKKSFYFQQLTELFHFLTEEEPLLRGIYISRVDLSKDGGICYIFFLAYPHLTEPPQVIFEQALEYLKLYKQSFRKAFIQTIHTKYAPDLMFLFDDKQEKIKRIDGLFDKINKSLQLEENTNKPTLDTTNTSLYNKKVKS